MADVRAPGRRRIGHGEPGARGRAQRVRPAPDDGAGGRCRQERDRLAAGRAQWRPDRERLLDLSRGGVRVVAGLVRVNDAGALAERQHGRSHDDADAGARRVDAEDDRQPRLGNCRDGVGRAAHRCVVRRAGREDDRLRQRVDGRRCDGLLRRGRLRRRVRRVDRCRRRSGCRRRIGRGRGRSRRGRDSECSRRCRSRCVRCSALRSSFDKHVQLFVERNCKRDCMRSCSRRLQQRRRQRRRRRRVIVDAEQRALQRDRHACICVVAQAGNEMHAGQRKRDPHCACCRRTDELNDRNERSVTSKPSRSSFRTPSRCPCRQFEPPAVAALAADLTIGSRARFGFPRLCMKTRS